MTGLVRKMSQAERDFRLHEKDLEREVVSAVLDRYLTPVAERACRNAADDACVEALRVFFERMRADILNNVDAFLPREGQGTPSLPFEPSPPLPPEPDYYRYDINLFVDNSLTKGAPIVVDDHPTFTNLLGCVERESEMGALVTDFTLIKAGSLHRANGGYLVLHMEDVLQHHGAWEGAYARPALGAGPRGGSGGRVQEPARTKGIEPEALSLNLKVVLVGSDDFGTETLLAHDDRFSKLFKIKAQMSCETERTAAGVRNWLQSLARVIGRGRRCCPFDATPWPVLSITAHGCARITRQAVAEVPPGARSHDRGFGSGGHERGGRGWTGDRPGFGPWTGSCIGPTWWKNCLWRSTTAI